MPLRVGALIIVAVVTLGHVAESLPPILATRRAHSCSCPIKGPCCAKDVCPMEAARNRADGVSLRSCGNASSPSGLPNLGRWTALFVEPTPTFATFASDAAFRTIQATPSPGFRHTIEHPPRPSFS